MKIQSRDAWTQKAGEVQSSDDRVADEYARHLYDESQHKPLDRQLLDRFADRVRGAGLVCDLGCGPGQVARYLKQRGIAVCGVDLSPEMVEHATGLNPGLQFSQGDMLALPVVDRAWAGIGAFYAIVNFPPADLVSVMREMWRALKPGGWLLISFHISEQIERVSGAAPCLSIFTFSAPSRSQAICERRDLKSKTSLSAHPTAPEVEYQSRRGTSLPEDRQAHRNHEQ